MRSRVLVNLLLQAAIGSKQILLPMSEGQGHGSALLDDAMGESAD